MEVVLLENIKNLGQIGDVVNVKRGHGRNFLIKYNKMKPTALEILESVDMLRILENGFKVNLFKTKYFSHAVDTKLDLRKVEKYLK